MPSLSSLHSSLPISELGTKLVKRYGEQVKNTPIQVCAPALEHFMQRADRIERSRIAKPSTKEVVRNQMEVLKVILEYYREKKEILSVEVLGIFALAYGIQKEQILIYANAFQQLEATKIYGKVIQPKAITPYLKSLKLDLPFKVKKLLDMKMRVWNTHELANKILGESYLEEYPSAYQRFTPACNLLEVIGNLVKLPVDTTEGIMGKGGAGASVWVSSRYRWTPITIPTWNIKFAILEEFSKNPGATISRVSEMKSIKNLIDSGPSCPAIRGAIDDLLNTGLISSKQERMQRVNTNCHDLIEVYHPTDLGLTLLEETREKGFLAEELRRKILGNHENKPKRKTLFRAKEILKWAKVKREIERREEKGLPVSSTEIAKRLGVPETYVHRVKHNLIKRCLGSKGKESINFKRMQQLLPSIRDISKDDANWLKNYLKKIENSQSSTD